jgi:hypothetical protein
LIVRVSLNVSALGLITIGVSVSFTLINLPNEPSTESIVEPEPDTER